MPPMHMIGNTIATKFKYHLKLVFEIERRKDVRRQRSEVRRWQIIYWLYPCLGMQAH